MHIFQLFGRDNTVKIIKQGQMYYIVSMDQGYVMT